MWGVNNLQARCSDAAPTGSNRSAGMFWDCTLRETTHRRRFSHEIRRRIKKKNAVSRCPPDSSLQFHLAAKGVAFFQPGPRGARSGCRREVSEAASRSKRPDGSTVDTVVDSAGSK